MAIRPAENGWVLGSVTRGVYQLTEGGMIEPAVLPPNSLTEDYNPFGFQACKIILVNSTTPVAIGGIIRPSGGLARAVYFFNLGMFDITLLRESAGSLASQRILLPFPTYVIKPVSGVFLYYVPDVRDRWIVIGNTPGASPEAACILRTINQDMLIPPDTTCIQRSPTIADGVDVRILNGGELLII